MSAAETQSLEVRLGPRSYAIEIGTGNLGRIADVATRGRRTTQVVIVTDENVEPTHANTVAEALDEAGLEVDLIVVEAGEETKCIEVADQLWEKLLDLGADRKTLVIAVGGGVVGDLAGFVAATYARGLPLVQVPTTLLAQVDSSVGGKTGINLPGAKNMVGAFWQPVAVLIDTSVLSTLPDQEYRAGLAEVVKYGVILDAEFFEYLETHRAGIVDRHDDVLRHIIASSCRLKADVVEQDEREETGLRGPQLRSHLRACHRGDDRLRPISARRSGGHRHDVRREVGRSPGAH